MEKEEENKKTRLECHKCGKYYYGTDKNNNDVCPECRLEYQKY